MYISGGNSYPTGQYLDMDSGRFNNEFVHPPNYATDNGILPNVPPMYLQPWEYIPTHSGMYRSTNEYQPVFQNSSCGRYFSVPHYYFPHDGNNQQSQFNLQESTNANRIDCFNELNTSSVFRPELQYMQPASPDSYVLSSPEPMYFPQMTGSGPADFRCNFPRNCNINQYAPYTYGGPGPHFTSFAESPNSSNVAANQRCSQQEMNLSFNHAATEAKEQEKCTIGDQRRYEQSPRSPQESSDTGYLANSAPNFQMHAYPIPFAYVNNIDGFTNPNSGMAFLPELQYMQPASPESYVSSSPEPIFFPQQNAMSNLELQYNNFPGNHHFNHYNTAVYGRNGPFFTALGASQPLISPVPYQYCQQQVEKSPINHNHIVPTEASLQAKSTVEDNAFQTSPNSGEFAYNEELHSDADNARDEDSSKEYKMDEDTLKINNICALNGFSQDLNDLINQSEGIKKMILNENSSENGNNQKKEPNDKSKHDEHHVDNQGASMALKDNPDLPRHLHEAHISQPSGYSVAHTSGNKARLGENANMIESTESSSDYSGDSDHDYIDVETPTQSNSLKKDGDKAHENGAESDGIPRNLYEDDDSKVINSLLDKKGNDLNEWEKKDRVTDSKNKRQVRLDNPNSGVEPSSCCNTSVRANSILNIPLQERNSSQHADSSVDDVSVNPGQLIFRKLIDAQRMAESEEAGSVTKITYEGPTEGTLSNQKQVWKAEDRLDAAEKSDNLSGRSKKEVFLGSESKTDPIYWFPNELTRSGYKTGHEVDSKQNRYDTAPTRNGYETDSESIRQHRSRTIGPINFRHLSHFNHWKKTQDIWGANSPLPDWNKWEKKHKGRKTYRQTNKQGYLPQRKCNRRNEHAKGTAGEGLPMLRPNDKEISNDTVKDIPNDRLLWRDTNDSENPAAFIYQNKNRKHEDPARSVKLGLREENLNPSKRLSRPILHQDSLRNTGSKISEVNRMGASTTRENERFGFEFLGQRGQTVQDSKGAKAEEQTETKDDFLKLFAPKYSNDGLTPNSITTHERLRRLHDAIRRNNEKAKEIMDMLRPTRDAVKDEAKYFPKYLNKAMSKPSISAKLLHHLQGGFQKNGEDTKSILDACRRELKSSLAEKLQTCSDRPGRVEVSDKEDNGKELNIGGDERQLFNSFHRTKDGIIKNQNVIPYNDSGQMTDKSCFKNGEEEQHQPAVPRLSFLACHEEFLKSIKSEKTLELLSSKKLLDELKEYDKSNCRNAKANDISKSAKHLGSVGLKPRKNGNLKNGKTDEISSDIEANSRKSINENHGKSQETNYAEKTGKRQTSNDKDIRLPELGYDKKEEPDGDKCVELGLMRNCRKSKVNKVNKTEKEVESVDIVVNGQKIINEKKREAGVKAEHRKTNNVENERPHELGYHETEEADDTTCIHLGLGNPKQVTVKFTEKSGDSVEEIDDSSYFWRRRSTTALEASLDETALNPIGDFGNKTSPIILETEAIKHQPCKRGAMGNSTKKEMIEFVEFLEEAISVYDVLTSTSHRGTEPEIKQARKELKNTDIKNKYRTETEIYFPVYMRLFFNDDRSSLETLAKMFEWIVKGDGIISTNDEDLLTMINMKIENFLATSVDDQDTEKLLQMKANASYLRIQLKKFPFPLQNTDLYMSRVITVSFPTKHTGLKMLYEAPYGDGKKENFSADNNDGSEMSSRLVKDYVKGHPNDDGSPVDYFESNLGNITTPSEKGIAEIKRNTMTKMILQKVIECDILPQFLAGNWQAIDPLLSAMKELDKTVIFNAKETIWIEQLESAIENCLATKGKFSEEERGKLSILKTIAGNILTKWKQERRHTCQLRLQQILPKKNFASCKNSEGMIFPGAASCTNTSTAHSVRRMKERIANIDRVLKASAEKLQDSTDFSGVASWTNTSTAHSVRSMKERIANIDRLLKTSAEKLKDSTDFPGAASCTNTSTAHSVRRMKERIANIDRVLKASAEKLKDSTFFPRLMPSRMLATYANGMSNVILKDCANEVMKRFFKSDRVMIDIVLKLFEKIESKEGTLVTKDKDFMKSVDRQIEILLLTAKDDAEKLKLLKLRAIVRFLDRKRKEERRNKMQGGHYVRN